MRRLLLLLLPLFMMAAVPLPCSAALPENNGGVGEEVSFSTKELNSTMMQEGTHQVADANGQSQGSVGSQSLLGRGWSLVKEHPVVSLFVLCLVLWLLFSCIIKGIKHLV